MRDQDDIGNHNVNINCKENEDVVDCNKTQNTVKNEVIINNNYKKIEVIEECNDENKSVKDDLNHDNVEERNPEDVAKNEEMNILPVAATQDVLKSQYRKVPREQLKISSQCKEVSTLLIVVALNNKTISKHAKI